MGLLVLRLVFSSKPALASLVMTGYVAAVGLVALTCGFFVERVTAHARLVSGFATPPSERKISRVERWLKSQSAALSVIETPAAEFAQPDSPATFSSDNVAVDFWVARKVPSAAVLAVSMDRSETYVAPGLRPVHQRRNFSNAPCHDLGVDPGNEPACEALAAVPASEPSASTATTSVASPYVASTSLQELKPSATVGTKLSRLEVVASAKAGKVKSGKKLAKTVKVASRKTKVAGFQARLSATRPGLKKPVLVVAPVLPPVKFKSYMRVRFADTPAEIIRASLKGTS